MDCPPSHIQAGTIRERQGMGSEVSMTAAEAKAVRRRLDVLKLAEELGNVSEACRCLGVTRSQFYEYKSHADWRG